MVDVEVECEFCDQVPCICPDPQPDWDSDEDTVEVLAKAWKQLAGAAREAKLARAVGCIQQRWRARGACMAQAGLAWWDSQRARKLGPLLSHVRFLQDLFRESKRRWSGAWKRGGRRGTGRVFEKVVYRCEGGRNLAQDEEFEAQAQLAQEMLSWYQHYVTVLRRLRSGRQINVIDGFCGGGGSTEGKRRAGGVGQGVDEVPQPDFIRRFSEGCGFRVGEATGAGEGHGVAANHSFILAPHGSGGGGLGGGGDGGGGERGEQQRDARHPG